VAELYSMTSEKRTIGYDTTHPRLLTLLCACYMAVYVYELYCGSSLNAVAQPHMPGMQNYSDLGFECLGGCPQHCLEAKDSLMMAEYMLVLCCSLKGLVFTSNFPAFGLP